MNFSSPFPVDQLIVPAAVILLGGCAVAYIATRSLVASIGVAFAKSTLYLVYYTLLFDGTFTFLDDWSYLQGGKILQEMGISSINVFSDFQEISSLANSSHVIYYLYNADSFRMFGWGYYSPVALNILLTFLAAAFVAGAAQGGLRLPKKLAICIFVFFLLHPDVLAWSTVMNGKDIVVLTGTMAITYAVSAIAGGQWKRAALLGTFVMPILFYTRFYVPFMLLGALASAVLIASGVRRGLMVRLFVLASFTVVSMLIGLHGLQSAIDLVGQSFINPFYGIIRFTLTPIPFNTEDSYAFLDLPQLFHWMLSPLLIWGIIRVWLRRTLTARFMVIYFILMVCLFGVFADLQGPRHRVQLDGLIAMFQFYGLISLLRRPRSENARLPLVVPPTSNARRFSNIDMRIMVRLPEGGPKGPSVLPELVGSMTDADAAPSAPPKIL